MPQKERVWKKRTGDELKNWYDEMEAKGIFKTDESAEHDNKNWCNRRHYVWLTTG